MNTNEKDTYLAFYIDTTKHIKDLSLRFDELLSQVVLFIDIARGEGHSSDEEYCGSLLFT